MRMARGMVSCVMGRDAPGEGLSAVRSVQPDGVTDRRPEPGFTKGALEEPRGMAREGPPACQELIARETEREGPDPPGSGPCS